MTIGMSTALRNARLDAITTAAGASAKLRLYTGTRPATGAAITSQTLLAELTCGATFAPAASGGVLTLNAITGDSSADASGTATWARLLKSDGTTHVLDMDVGTSGADFNMNSNVISAGAAVSITSATLTEANA
ncbi:hypothetical protein [Cupriavidus campinensis]|uniref:Uncharacterized protein n=1 Tax=Cupriavidus campinensis TaxID=151783 RepID=A0AAE9I3N8_9BURK|nr:hypothetical protein [Cupriavidus campinensis]URF02959.1 hypothetical protein M5D45_10370 [Cupriavidus campinensis]URF05497.1 hypothetical protein M5D45_06740 [Cupriavidus campinensis]